MSDNKEQEVIAPPLDQKALFDLGHGLLSNMKDQQLRNHEIHLAQIEVQKMQYAGSKLAFLYRYWLVVALLIVFIGISIGFIFVRDDPDTGLIILSYLGVAIFSFIGGIGYQKTQ